MATTAVRNETHPAVLAHRGLRQYAPENTSPAFAAAIEVGLSLEFDVYQTTDEGLVVIHDETVDRTTNGTGEVSQMALADIRRLDAGGWFHPVFAGVKVPTLEEVFQLIVERQRTPATIGLNLKVISPGIEKRIAADVERYGLFDQLLAFGQPSDSSRRLKDANPKMRICARVPGWSYDKEQYDMLLADPLVDCLGPVDFVPSAKEIERTHRVGKQVLLALNVDIPEEIGDHLPDTDAFWDEARRNGVDGIFTDYPLEHLWRWRMAAGPG